MNPLALVAIQEVPSVIALLKAAFKQQNPDAPQPTDADVIAAYNQAFAASILKDENWLAAHPA